MKRSGFADLPLHGGRVPPWLAERMEKLGTAITEAILQQYGTKEFLSRIKRPVLVSGAGCGDGDGLALFGHHDFGVRRTEARVESAGA